jgi:hypothetical protein
VNGWTCDVHSIQSGSSATGKYTPASSVMPAITNVAPAFVCLNRTTAAVITRPNGANASAATAASGTAAAAVDQRTSRPKTIAA